MQGGRDRPRKEVMNRCQGKALSEGCHKRKKARVGVSSREKMDTNKNLARATTKSKSEMQTVSNGCVSRGEEMEVLRSIPTLETSSSEQDRSQVVLRAMFNGDKTYDNRTEEIHRSQRTTNRDGNHWFAGTSNLSGWRLEGACN